MIDSRWGLFAALCLAFFMVGCKASSDFSEDVARGAIESHPLTLEGEQVTLTDSQIRCGVQSEFWDAPTSISPGHTTAHLSAKGRELKFNDDLIIHDPGSTVPYIQVRGDFSLAVDSIASMKDAEDKGKLVEAKVRARIANPCFQDGLPLMGVRHGNFNADSPVVFHLHFDDTGWHVDKLLH
jgi:hypothetical protein